MQNSYLINIVNEFQKIKEDSIKIFGKLSLKQFNWRPAENKWSIGQCFDHLIITNEKYFPEFEELIKGNFNIW